MLTGPVTNFQAADNHNKRLEKGMSTGSIPHIFSSGFVHELPFGGMRVHGRGGWRNWLRDWQIGGIIRAQPAARSR